MAQSSKEYHKKYNIINKEKRQSYAREYYKRNKKKSIERVNKWRKENKERWRKTRNKREASLDFKSKPNYIWRILRQNCKRKNRTFPLKKESFTKWYEKQEKICFYCGIDEKTHKKILNRRLEIDRVINELPYKITNIVLCCRYCNNIKGSFLNKEEMLFIGKNIVKNKWKQKRH